MLFLRKGVWIAAGALVLALLFAGAHSAGETTPTTQSAKPLAAGVASRAHDAARNMPVALDTVPLAGPVGPDKVVAGVYIANIQRVDRTTNSFNADFYVWLRWSNPDLDPTTGIDIVNAYESWALTQTPVYDEPRLQPDGSRVWLIHYQGSFNAPLSLSDYPFEKQTLRIVIEEGEENVKRIVYEPDKDPIELDPSITLAGYNFAQPRIEFDTNTYPSSFGEIEASTEDRSFTRITVEMPISSPAVSGIVKIILPIVIVLVTSGLGLLIPAAYVDSKVNVPITAMIALVAMHFVIATSLPDVNYLLMIDLIYILAYATVTAMLAGAVLGAWVLKSRGEDAAMTVQRRFLTVTSAAFLASLAAVLLTYLSS